MTITSIRDRRADGRCDDWAWPARPSRRGESAGRRTSVYLRGDRIDRADLAHSFGHVDAGLIAGVRTDTRGQKIIVELRGTGATLSEDSLSGHRPSGADIDFEALVPTRVRWTDPATLVAPHGDELARAILAVIATRIRQQHETACRHRLQSLAQRVADQLVTLSHETVLGSDLSALQHLSRFDLARILGTNRSAVSKICTGFEHRGWCRIDGKSITLVDEAAMASFATRGLSPLDGELHERLLAHQGALIALATDTRIVVDRATDSVA